MKKWVKINFSKKVRENHTIHKSISCLIEYFDFESLRDDIAYYDTTEIKISSAA